MMHARAVASIIALVVGAATLHADPRLTSWMTTNSTKYGRVTETTTTAPVAVWPSPGIPKNAGSPTQTVPAYADVQQILVSTNFVYVRSADFASHRMGPWYKEYEKLTVNGLWPSNRKLTSKIPRNPVAVSNPIVVAQQVGQGPVGVLVNGVTIANLGDGSGYDTALAKDAGVTGGGIPGNQSDVWIRNATGAAIAMAAIEMAMAGIEFAIPADEVIDTMGEIGANMDVRYRETAGGGLAATPTGRRLAKERLYEIKRADG